LQLPRNIYDEMVAHARAELPNECCGLLAGRIGADEPARGVVEKRYPLVNQAGSPTEYLSEPRSMFTAEKDMRKNGIDILAIYHSHPTSEPLPSKTDLERSYSADVVNFIVSLKDDQVHMRAWWLREKDFIEAEWDWV
jgi:proteasome lid subunit RPN8/RPN11